MNPLVSICIPTYNGAQYIKEAMESAINQTYSNIEIVVSDDASTDGTLKIIEQFKEKTKIPIYIHHHIPNGIGANWNNAINKASGNYIKFIFQDDVLMPNCIESMVAVLENDSSIGLVACKRDFIVEENYNTVEIENWINVYGDLQKNLNTKFVNGIGYIDKTMFRSTQFLMSPLNKIGEPSVTMFRKKIVKSVGFFREDLKQILDYEFYYRILKKKKIAVLEEKFVQFRLHPQQATNINRGNDNDDYIKYDCIIYKEYFWLMPFEKKIKMLEKYNSYYKFLKRVQRKLKL